MKKVKVVLKSIYEPEGNKPQNVVFYADDALDIVKIRIGKYEITVLKDDFIGLEKLLVESTI